MNEKHKSMIKSVLVLCIIAAMSGLLLGLVNKITYVDPAVEAMNKFKKLSGSSADFTAVEYDGDKYTDVLYFVKSADETPVYGILAKGSGGFKGDVQMYVFIKENKIYKIVQGENSETFFGDVEKSGFYDKFYDADLTSAADFPSGSGDLVSGATKTSGAVTNAVNAAKKCYSDYIKGA